MLEQSAIQKKLNEAFIQSKIKNPAFSLRAFARKLDMSPSAVSEIIQGKRRISRKLAERIICRLSLDPKEARSLLKLFSQPGTQETSPAEYLELSTDRFRTISEWYHFGILSLAETRGFQSDSKWIASRLKLRVQEVEKALERLERLGMIRREAGKIKVTGQQYSTPDNIADLAIQKFQSDNLDLAKRSLDEDAVDLRDFTSMTATSFRKQSIHFPKLAKS